MDPGDVNQVNFPAPMICILPHKLVEQGVLGSCWFLAALSGVARYPELTARCIGRQR